LAHELGRRLQLFRRQIDWLLVSDVNDAQIRGLVGLAGRVHIREALLPDATGGPRLDRLIADLTAADVSLFSAAVGQALDLGDDIRLEVLLASERAVLLQLVYGNSIVVLVPGDEAALQTPWLQSGAITAWILSNDSTLNSLEFVGSPIVIVPGLRPTEALGETIRLLPSSELGWVELATDGIRLWAWSERRAR
jgi:hypothetical protein